MIDATETDTATKQPKDDVAELEKRAHESIDRLLEQRDREQERDSKQLARRRSRQHYLNAISAPLLTIFGVCHV